MRTAASFMRKKTQRGIALIEALIAILLFSLGILALVGLQAVMSKNVTQSKYRGEASFLANQLIGQMWVDKDLIGNYAIASGACTVSSYANCTNWYDMVTRMLPGGSAEVTIDPGCTAITSCPVLIVLSWTMPGESVANRYQVDVVVAH